MLQEITTTEKIYTDLKGFTYQRYDNDPYGVRLYTLANGLKIYLAKNFDAPKIQTFIAVKTGSNNDPKDNTGLAHYLEHMMFKGTSKLGTSDWDKEKPLLDEISNLFEQHKLEENPERKKEIYRKIDELSQHASQYAIANEYDKAVSALGASATNAHTWLDETVYKNVIPANELNRWLQIEKERFSDLVLRLFHTELESVYEEFNRAQDNDGRLVHNELMNALFPTHPNGQQTTLGDPEHLKNPSMVAIHKYFSDFYVPNNLAFVLVGDLEFEATVALINQHFGSLAEKTIAPREAVVEKPMTAIVERTVQSPSAPRLHLAWRTDSYGTKNARLAEMAGNILTNSGECGLLDLNINQDQKALYASAYSSFYKNYGSLTLVIVPQEDQTLDLAKTLLLEQVQILKNGAFPDWMLEAIVSDMKLSKQKALETADGLGTALYTAFINNQNWDSELNEIQEFEKITKNELVAFANEFFADNYVVIKKERGENQKLLRVQNPEITPVTLHKDVQSVFLQDLLSQKSAEIQPQFLDYNEAIETKQVLGKTISFVKNNYNEIANLYFIFPFGTDHDRELGLATQVLQYLGTDQLNATQLKQEFFKLGVAIDFRVAPKELIISLVALQKNMHQGMLLLKNWLMNAKPDQNVYQENVRTILQSRDVAKNDKTRIAQALVNYAKYGADSRLRNVIDEEKLYNITSSQMTDKVKKLLNMPYEIFFYGNDFQTFQQYISDFIEVENVEIPAPKIYPEMATSGKTFFVNYDMVQVEMSQIAKAKILNFEIFGAVRLFNEYFGRGLSSIVFQEIRESKSLAYSAYVSYNTAAEKSLSDYVSSYIGTQPDKLDVAVDTLGELMHSLPQIPLQFENARTATLMQIATSRITRVAIFFTHHNLKKIGVSYDIREAIYQQISQLSLADLSDFHQSEIKPLHYNTALIGKREAVLENAQKYFGAVTELSLEEIFGY